MKRIKRLAALIALGLIPASCSKQEVEPKDTSFSSSSSVQSSSVERVVDEFEESLTITLDELKEMREDQQSFCLVAHRITCPYCQEALPYLLNYMQIEMEIAAVNPSYQSLNLYLISTQDNREVVDYLSEILIPIAEEGDVSKESGTFYIPNLSIFIDGEPTLFETGLPQTQDSMTERLDEVKATIAFS